MCATAPDHPDETCATAQLACLDPPETYRYWVLRSIGDGPYEPVASTCLGPGDTGELDVITPGRVMTAMKRLAWPEAVLTIQPPDGRTLVNFPTNFYTDTTHPTTQTITLLGQRVDIEATPVDYAWHFGDATSQHGSDAGAPYPDLRITHVYRDADVTIRPRVDVTYHGRYRVNGGAWQDIPETLTVAGTPQPLEVVSATPRLVG